MKIGYFADGPWSHVAIDKIAADTSFQLVFIVPRYDASDPILEAWSRKLDIPFLIEKNVNDSEFLKTIEQYDADIFISMSYNQILKKEILSIPPKGFINCHAGSLPFYRGRNPLNWVLINGEKEFGITVHFVDEGIDTGDIIIQKTFPITINDTYKSLLDLAIIECANILLDAIKQIQDDTYTRTKQIDIHEVGTYFGKRVEGDEILNFNQNSKKIHDFIRALAAPGPGARAFINDKEIVIHESRLIKNAPKYISTIGEVIGRDKDGVTVKTKDSSILITKVSELNQNNVFIPQYRIGTRLKLL